MVYCSINKSLKLYIITVLLLKEFHGDSMVKLTRRQAEVLAIIKKTIASTGMPPTRAEIAIELGFRSANAAEEHLRALCRKGAIEILPGTSRGLKIIPEATESSDAEEGLPIVGKVAAGAPILAQENIEQYCQLPTDFFSPCADYLLTVQGESMKDAGILDGDLVAIHKTNTAHNGQIIVARISDEVTVKRFEKQKNKIMLHPENEAFEPITVSPDCLDFAIEGVCVGVIRH